MIHKIVGNLYISDMQGVREGDTSDFDVIIGVCQDSARDNVSCEYAHYPLTDGPVNEVNTDYGGEWSIEMLHDAIDQVVMERIKRKKVLVHCHAGVSRSAGVCIGALAVLNGLTFEESKEKVEQAKYIQPAMEVQDAVREYIEESSV